MIPDNISLHHFALSRELLKRGFTLDYGVLDLPKLMTEQGIHKLFFDFSDPRPDPKGIHYDFTIVMTHPLSKIHSIKLSKTFHLEEDQVNPLVFSHTFKTSDGYMSKEKMTTDFEFRFQAHISREANKIKGSIEPTTSEWAQNTKAGELHRKLKPKLPPADPKKPPHRIR